MVSAASDPRTAGDRWLIMRQTDTMGPWNLLVIDTSTDRTAVAVSTRGGEIHAGSIEGSGKHGRDLLPRVRELLGRAGLAPGELDLVAVGLGPGSYTGLRIGLTAARVLAYAAGAGLLGFDSLEGMARGAPGEALRVHVVADAQRGDVYAAEFARAAPHEPLTRVSGSRIEPLASWIGRLGEDGFVLGPGLDSSRIHQALPAGLAIAGPELRRPRAGSLLELALDLARDGRRDDLWTTEPNYLRRSAAEDQWDARGSRST
jgi:tRNA threonylcarbamoyladenosine biosynthesis protein TsaB